MWIIIKVWYQLTHCQLLQLRVCAGNVLAHMLSYHHELRVVLQLRCLLRIFDVHGSRNVSTLERPDGIGKLHRSVSGSHNLEFDRFRFLDWFWLDGISQRIETDWGRRKLRFSKKELSSWTRRLELWSKCLLMELMNVLQWRVNGWHQLVLQKSTDIPLAEGCWWPWVDLLGVRVERVVVWFGND